MNAPDPWAWPVPTADREDIIERGTVTRAQIESDDDDD